MYRLLSVNDRCSSSANVSYEQSDHPRRWPPMTLVGLPLTSRWPLVDLSLIPRWMRRATRGVGGGARASQRFQQINWTQWPTRLHPYGYTVGWEVGWGCTYCGIGDRRLYGGTGTGGGGCRLSSSRCHWPDRFRANNNVHIVVTFVILNHWYLDTRQDGKRLCIVDVNRFRLV